MRLCLFVLLWLSLPLCGQELTVTRYGQEEGLAGGSATEVYVGRRGELYVATYRDYYRFDGQSFALVDRRVVDSLRMDPAPPLDTATLKAFFSEVRGQALSFGGYTTDLQGRTWVAAREDGLLRLAPGSTRLYTGRDGLDAESITTLYANDSTLYVGTDRGGLQRLQDGRFVRHRVDLLDPRSTVTGIAEDPAGRLILSTTDGLLLPDSISYRNLGAGNLGTPLLIDSTLWLLSLTQGLYLLNPYDSFPRLRRPSPRDSLPAFNYKGMVADGRGGLLLSTLGDGIVGYRSGRGSLAVDQPETLIQHLALRRGTQLWWAVPREGLFYTDLDQQPIRIAQVPDRFLPDDDDYCQLYAPENAREVWLGSKVGYHRITLDGDGQPLYARQYGAAEGFVGTPVPGLPIVQRNDKLWFATDKGLISFDPAVREDYLPAPATYLDSVSLLYQSVTDGRTDFTARENYLGFHFRAFDLTYPERIAYRYRLSPLDKRWSPLTRERTVRYASLAGGGYTFEAQATTDGGKTWGAAASYHFTIARPLYLHPGVLIGGIALFTVGLIAALYAWHRRTLRRQSALRSELERKNRLLELEQKALQLQMNPHFIFNALNGIRGRVTEAEAREQISRFAQLLRGILHNSRQEYITLAEEIATLEAYLRMEQFCQPNPFTFTLHPPDFDPEEVTLPPMLLQPFVENAIIHGFNGLGRTGTLDLRFTLRGRRVQCLVVDSGVGRAAAAARTRERGGGHRSVAVAVTRERVEALGGRLVITDPPGGGTEVLIELPVGHGW